MNVYDFDKTIYPTDCAIEFCFWCMKRNPKLWFTYFPNLVKVMVQRKLGIVPEYLKHRKFLSYLTMIDDLEEQVEKYWNKNEKKIASWYLKQKKEDNLIISASPYCLIEPIANRLGVKFMATEYDLEFGVFTNNLMYAKEKARYIFDHGFPVIDNFYSDSLSDTPLALCAEKAYLVKDKARTVVDWPDLDAETIIEVKDKIDTGWNIHLKED